MGVFEEVGTLKGCPRCGRKILVERSLLGVCHTADIDVICWDCLTKVEKEKAIENYGVEKNEKK